MIKDFKTIIRLIKELIWLYHPITMDIRWKFHERLSYITFAEKWESREKWEKSIRKGNEDGVRKFFRAIFRNKRFRKNIIAVLEDEVFDTIYGNVR